MFTGLVQALGVVKKIEPDGAGCHLHISETDIASAVVIGESVAINGVCLTVVETGGDTMRFQAGPETLQRTNLGELQQGDRVNLEQSLRMGDRLGGHWVQGHVDGLGTIANREPQGEWETVWFQCDPQLAVQMVQKGSIAVDGISLTVVDVTDDRFSVALIPHTLAVTTLGTKQVGDSVNLETDILAKYIGRYLDSIGAK